ncbi:MAG: acyltransferase [Clostridiales bacterium]|nr:acyltransferase [Clostridiales bacterium]
MGHGTGGRNHTLDFLKGFAICMVVFTHFEWRDAERALPLFPYLVDMAVPIFMVISGYTYAMSMERHGITTLQDALSWDNIKTKLIRYTAPFLIIAAWELIDKNIHVNAEQPLEYLAWIIRGTDGKGSYYYPLLIQLIFVFPLIKAVFDRWKEKGLIVCFLINGAYEVIRWAYGMNDDCYRLLIFRYIFIIGAGIFAYRRYRIGAVPGILITAAGAAYIAAVKYLGFEPAIIKMWPGTSYIAVMYLVPAVIWILQDLNIRFAPVELIGKASYHIFLIQMLYYRGYYKILDGILGRKQLLAASMVVCIIIGLIFYKADKELITKTILSGLNKAENNKETLNRKGVKK